MGKQILRAPVVVLILVLLLLLQFRDVKGEIRQVLLQAQEKSLNKILPVLVSGEWPGPPTEQPSVYTESEKLMAVDAQAGDSLGVSVAMDGSTLVIGAWQEDGGPGDPNPKAGAAYVFEWETAIPSSWGQVAKLTAGDAQADDSFGVNVAIDGDTIVVGARAEDGGPGDPKPNAGAVYVFERNLGGPNNWGQAAKLTASDAQAGDYFGWPVAIFEDTIIIGAPFADVGKGSPLPFSGAAYVFTRSPNGLAPWQEIGKLTAGDAQPYDYFGSAVAIHDDVMLVSAEGEDGGPGDPLPAAGSVYVFEPEPGGASRWIEAAILRASDLQAGDAFGRSVGADGNTVVIGAGWEDGGQGDPLPDAGAVYVFNRENEVAGTWAEVGRLTASDAQEMDWFGTYVAIDGDTIVVGTTREDGGPGDPVPQAGAAYVFDVGDVGSGNWTETAKLTVAEAQDWDRLGPVSISGDTILLGALGESGGPGDPMPGAGAAYIFVRLVRNYLPLLIRP